MFLKQWLTPSRLFLYTGFTLIILAFVAFPTGVWLQTQPGDYDYSGIGWLFSPIIGIWGLASIVLGIVQSSMPKLKTLQYMIPIIVLIIVGLLFAGWLAIMDNSALALIISNPFWWIYFSLFLIPCLIIGIIAFLFLKNKEKLDSVLARKRLRNAILSTIIIVTLLYTITLFLFLF